MESNFEHTASAIASITAIALFFPSFYKNIIAPFIEYRQLKASSFSLVGTWLSTWEPKAHGEPT